MIRPTVAVPSASSPTPAARPARVAMALYTDLDFDSRVLREATTLSEAGYEVTVYCLTYDGPPPAGFRVVAHVPERTSVVPGGDRESAPRSRLAAIVDRLGWMVGYVRNLRAWGRWATREAGDVDVWHAHDLPGLMAVAPFVLGPRLVYDSHEIYLETGAARRLPGLARRLLGRYERRLVTKVDALVTVNEGYADVLRRRLHPRRLEIVRNCPPRRPATTEISPLRAACGVGPGAAIVLYHGALGAHRGIEQLVATLRQPGMEAVHVALLGFGNVAALGVDPGDPALAGRVHVLPAVPPADLVEWVAGADVDAMPLQRSTLNHWLCTPNKLWESLTAGVPVVASDFPMMRRVIDDPAGPLGTVCQPDDPASIATAIRAILDQPAEDRAGLRRRVLEASTNRWNWETESARLVAVYADLTGSSASAGAIGAR